MEIHSWCCAWLCKFTPTWCWPRVFTRLQRVLVEASYTWNSLVLIISVQMQIGDHANGRGWCPNIVNELTHLSCGKYGDNFKNILFTLFIQNSVLGAHCKSVLRWMPQDLINNNGLNGIYSVGGDLMWGEARCLLCFPMGAFFLHCTYVPLVRSQHWFR